MLNAQDTDTLRLCWPVSVITGQSLPSGFSHSGEAVQTKNDSWAFRKHRKEAPN